MAGILSELATKHQTDKWNHHWYCDFYEKALSHLKDEPISLLEIGVGGYEFSDRGGQSARMWNDYFTKGIIYSLDYYSKIDVTLPERCIIFQGDQSDPEVLSHINNISGGFDVVVDDGSHVCEHQIKTFEILFPLLKPRGIYCIEDVHTSYWEEYGFGGRKFNGREGLPLTCIEYFMHRIHQMHHVVNGLVTDDLTASIESIQFSNSLIIIQKGENRNEGK